MPGKTLTQEQQLALAAVRVRAGQRVEKMREAKANLNLTQRGEDKDLSRYMNEAIAAGVPKSRIADAVGIANFHVLRDLYNLTEKEFRA